MKLPFSILLLVIAVTLHAHGQHSRPPKPHYGPANASLFESDIRATALAYSASSLNMPAPLDSFFNKFMGEQATTGVDVASGIPLTFNLSQNYPNPFNPTTNIEYRIANLGLVQLRVFDVLGKQISTLVNEVRAPGSYTVRWDATQFPSGVYFCQLCAGDFVATGKMMLTK